MIELFCHKATAAPSVVEIDKQPQVYQINAQLVVRNCSPHISKIYSKENFNLRSDLTLFDFSGFNL